MWPWRMDLTGRGQFFLFSYCVLSALSLHSYTKTLLPAPRWKSWWTGGMGFTVKTSHEHRGERPSEWRLRRPHAMWLQWGLPLPHLPFFFLRESFHFLIKYQISFLFPSTASSHPWKHTISSLDLYLLKCASKVSEHKSACGLFCYSYTNSGTNRYFL